MKCIPFDAFDPVVFGIVVFVRVVGVERGSTKFFRLILLSDCSVGTQVICEGEMPVDLWREARCLRVRQGDAGKGHVEAAALKLGQQLRIKGTTNASSPCFRGDVDRRVYGTPVGCALAVSVRVDVAANTAAISAILSIEATMH